MNTATPLAKSKSYIKDNTSRSVARGKKETRKSDVNDSLMKFLDACSDEDLLIETAFSPPKKSLPLSRSEHVPSPGESGRPTRKGWKPELHLSPSKTEISAKRNFVGQSEHGTPSTEKRALCTIRKDMETVKDDDGRFALMCDDSPRAASPKGSANSKSKSKKRSSSRRRSSSRTPLKRSSSERHDASSDRSSGRSSSRTALKRSSSERHDASSNRSSGRSSSRTPLKLSSSERHDASSDRSSGRSSSRTPLKLSSSERHDASSSRNSGRSSSRTPLKRSSSEGLGGPSDRSNGRAASRGIHRTRSESTNKSLSGILGENDRLTNSLRRRSCASVGGPIDDQNGSGPKIRLSAKLSPSDASVRSPGRNSGRIASRGVNRAKSESATKSLSGHTSGVDRLGNSQRRRMSASLVSPIVDDANGDDDGCSVSSAHSTVSRRTGRAGRSIGLDAGPLNALMNSGQRRGSMTASSGATVGSNIRHHNDDSDEESFLSARRKRQDEIMNQAIQLTNEKSSSDLSQDNVHEHLHDFEVGGDDDQPMTQGQKMSAFTRLKQGISKTGKVTKSTARGTVNCVRDPKRVAMKVTDFAKDLGKETGKMLLDPKLAAMTAVSLGKDVTIGTYKVTREVGMGVALGGLGLTKTVARTGLDATSMVVEGAGKVVTGATGLIFKHHNDEEDKYDDYNASERADRRLGQKSLLDRFAESSPPEKTDGAKPSDTRLKNYLPALVVGNGTNQGWDY